MGAEGYTLSLPVPLAACARHHGNSSNGLVPRLGSRVADSLCCPLCREVGTWKSPQNMT